MTRAKRKVLHRQKVIKARQRAKVQQKHTGLAFSVIFLIIIIGLIWATI